MPTTWVEPPLFLVYKGVKVYYTYKFEDMNGPPHEYHYTVDIYNDVGFDIRDLRNIKAI